MLNKVNIKQSSAIHIVKTNTASYYQQPSFNAFHDMPGRVLRQFNKLVRLVKTNQRYTTQ